MRKKKEKIDLKKVQQFMSKNDDNNSFPILARHLHHIIHDETEFSHRKEHIGVEYLNKIKLSNLRWLK